MPANQSAVFLAQSAGYPNRTRFEQPVVVHAHEETCEEESPSSDRRLEALTLCLVEGVFV